jgi:predicted MFS family arabinose efflux permease
MMSGLPSVIAASLADVVPPRQFAGVFARCTFAFAAAQLCGTPLAGFLAEATGGFLVPFLLASAMAVVGAILSVDVMRTSEPSKQARVGDGHAADRRARTGDPKASGPR